MENNMSMVFDAKSENEGLARMVISAFITELDPTIEELNDVKTAVSEAVTNSIIHGYNGTEGKVYMDCSLDMEENENHGTLKITVKDQGVGIENVEKAKEPLFTTNRNLSVLVWDLCLWKCLWMIYMWNQNYIMEQLCA